jgi:hypothetical protein
MRYWNMAVPAMCTRESGCTNDGIAPSTSNTGGLFLNMLGCIEALKRFQQLFSLQLRCNEASPDRQRSNSALPTARCNICLSIKAQVFCGSCQWDPPPGLAPSGKSAESRKLTLNFAFNDRLSFAFVLLLFCQERGTSRNLKNVRVGTGRNLEDQRGDRDSELLSLSS